MALDLEEQEQLDEFKVWWNKNGSLITNAVIGILLALVAWQGYHYFQHKNAVEASNLYQSMMQLETDKTNEIKTLSAKLMEGYAGTPYAGRAAVYAAKASFSADDTKSAKAQLNWATQHAEETSVKAIASLSLASLLMEEKKYDEALAQLAKPIDAGYAGLQSVYQGDIYLAQGKQDAAKKAYESALPNLEVTGRLHALITQKLESLGG